MVQSNFPTVLKRRNKMSDKKGETTATAKECVDILKGVQLYIEECENKIFGHKEEITNYKKKIKEYKHQINLHVQYYFKEFSSYSQPEIKDLLSYLYWENIVDKDFLEGCVPLPPEEVERIVKERIEIYPLSKIFQEDL